MDLSLELIQEATEESDFDSTEEEIGEIKPCSHYFGAVIHNKPNFKRRAVLHPAENSRKTWPIVEQPQQ